MISRWYFYSITCPKHDDFHSEGVIEVKSLLPEPWKAIIIAKKLASQEGNIEWVDLHVNQFNRV